MTQVRIVLGLRLGIRMVAVERAILSILGSATRRIDTGFGADAERSRCAAGSVVGEPNALPGAVRERYQERTTGMPRALAGRGV